MPVIRNRWQARAHLMRGIYGAVAMGLGLPGQSHWVGGPKRQTPPEGFVARLRWRLMWRRRLLSMVPGTVGMEWQLHRISTGKESMPR